MPEAPLEIKRESIVSSNPIVEITVKETEGIRREREPLTWGVPFPKGLLSESLGLRIVDEAGDFVPMTAAPLAYWIDGSIKWILLDVQVSVPANGTKTLQVYPEALADRADKDSPPALELSESQEKLLVRTGQIEFVLDSAGLLPFSQITVNNRPLLREHAARIALTDEHDRVWQPCIDAWTVETRNPLRLVLRFDGTFKTGQKTHVLRYTCRIHFFAGKSTVRIDFTIHNPRAARHPGGVWDLGSQGSCFFRDLSLELSGPQCEQADVAYALDLGDPLQKAAGNLLVYQDSSGGEHWRSHNHINRYEQIPVSFRGFEVRNDQQVLSRGLRATPCMAISHPEGTLAASVKHFWQNFPTALEADHGTLKIGLFPMYFNDLFELQGGEQKTHTIYVSATDGPLPDGWLEWAHRPLIPRLAPEWYYTSGACPRPVPVRQTASDAYAAAYQRLVDVAIRGPRCFFARRELIDEYGWRNFGDLYADHEAVFHQGEQEFVSHYNNQYDVIKGALIQFMRTGDPAWFRLADEHARHVADIDIYHTDQDRYEFNHGLFWHTDHHLDAATSTHRSASRKHWESKDPRLVGGGPSYSHNYAAGFVYHYWLTGEHRSKESVLALAENVRKGVEGSDIFLERCLKAGKEFLKGVLKKPRSLERTEDRVYEFDGPGRASGNVLKTLLDGYLLTSSERYLHCAETLIWRCVSIDDPIDDRNLLNAEFRWMYNIFLQSLGYYLDIKHEVGQLDQSFWSARMVLLNYAAWMLEHEYPYLDKPEILEFPNETWSAQEMRKSDVLAHAAQYAPEPLRQQLLGKSRFFFELCFNQLRDDFADTCDLTRVIAILMSNGMIHLEAYSGGTCVEAIASKDINYTLPDANPPGLRAAVTNQLTRFLQVLRNTSLKKELRWISQRVKNH
jgi:hypothetical protein